MKLKTLQKKYPKFIYRGYSFGISKDNLEILFDFKIEPDITFQPKVTIKNLAKPGLAQLDNLVFHLGLIEMISYWKATCSPLIEIRASSLTREQVKWWQELIVKGMGQFFFENKIPFQKPIIKTSGKSSAKPGLAELRNRVLVPMGGGKDSIVTWEFLKRAKKDINCFSLNPRQGVLVMKMAGCKKPVIVKRQFDKKLLELNRKGFLNGHTPFSAYLAFLSVLAAVVFNYKYIAFSNERSSNEGNVKYLGKIINHQWSKSFEFEKMFREYSKKYLVKQVEYFSFLRPLYELQIAKLFSAFPKYFPVFLSCNEAYKTYSGTKRPLGIWCARCPKCLFVFAALFPFMKKEKLIKIFKKNLFQDKKLVPLMNQLIGERGFKPFECVGTKDESLIAFYLSWKKDKKKTELLKYFEDKVLLKYPNLEKKSKTILSSFNKQHNLPKNLQPCLKT